MQNITPTNEQNAAITDIVDWYFNRKEQEYYLAGYAGVGKSTIAEFAIARIKERKKNLEVRTCAYTGKAASVLRSKGIESATTIHGLIYRPRINKQTGELRGFKLDKNAEAAEADLIIVDECSMTDDETAEDLRSFDKKMLIMGDPGQLPPVKGTGAFTNRKPDFFLTEIHRQAADSPILELATLARQGKRLPIGFDKGGVRVLAYNEENARLTHEVTTQPICGLNRVRHQLNRQIRHEWFGVENSLPIKDEKLICCHNNHMLGIFNGVMGKAVAFGERQHAETPGTYNLTVRMDEDTESLDLIVDPYLFRNTYLDKNQPPYERLQTAYGDIKPDVFDYGYALTAHKAQGSQFKHVTVIDDSGAFREDKAKWLYTALTRATHGLTVLLRTGK